MKINDNYHSQSADWHLFFIEKGKMRMDLLRWYISHRQYDKKYTCLVCVKDIIFPVIGKMRIRPLKWRIRLRKWRMRGSKWLIEPAKWRISSLKEPKANYLFGLGDHHSFSCNWKNAHKTTKMAHKIAKIAHERVEMAHRTCKMAHKLIERTKSQLPVRSMRPPHFPTFSKLRIRSLKWLIQPPKWHITHAKSM